MHRHQQKKINYNFYRKIYKNIKLKTYIYIVLIRHSFTLFWKKNKLIAFFFIITIIDKFQVDYYTIVCLYIAFREIVFPLNCSRFVCLFVCLFVRPVSEPKMDAIDKLETEYNDLEESNSWMDVFQVSNSVFSYTFFCCFVF